MGGRSSARDKRPQVSHYHNHKNPRGLLQGFWPGESDKPMEQVVQQRLDRAEVGQGFVNRWLSRKSPGKAFVD